MKLSWCTHLIYIKSYSLYFNESLWLIITFRTTNTFSMIYNSNRAYITGPFKTREYIDYNTPYIVNRPNQPLYIIISDRVAHVAYEEPYGDVLYNSDFEFYDRYESEISELRLMTIVKKKE